jgi:HPt (histidine-containing phosphotransfer) domain-containing protein
MDDYVTKPLQPRVLFSALDRWIKNDSSSNDAQEQVQDYSSTSDAYSLDFDDGMFGEEMSSASPTMKTVAPVQQTLVASDAPPVDIESAIERFDGDRSFIMNILNEFKEHLPERLKEIHNSLQAGDVNMLCRLAHNLKGVSLNICADPLAQAALDLETIALREDLAGASFRVAQLDLEATRLTEFLSTQITKGENS